MSCHPPPREAWPGRGVGVMEGMGFTVMLSWVPVPQFVGCVVLASCGALLASIACKVGMRK